MFNGPYTLVPIEELPNYRVSVVKRGDISVGKLQLEELPGGEMPPPGSARSRIARRVRVRAAMLITFFWKFVLAVVAELKRSGFLLNSSRFDSHTHLDLARRELNGAEEPAAFATVGVCCAQGLGLDRSLRC